MKSVLDRIPVVGGPAYIERVRRLPSALSVTLAAELDNRYFRHAIAVLANGEKVGYVAPEVARRYFEPVAAQPTPVACPARRASSCCSTSAACRFSRRHDPGGWTHRSARVTMILS